MKMVYAHGKLRVVIIFEVNLLPNLSGREMSNEQELKQKKKLTLMGASIPGLTISPESTSALQTPRLEMAHH